MKGVIPVYRPTGSPLHATRPPVGLAFTLAPALAGLLCFNPIVLAGALAATIAGGVAAGVGDQLVRAARFALPLAILIVAVNALTSSEGLTLLAQGPVVPVLGRLDVTLEAIVYGGVVALRAVVVVLSFALFSATVDPDRLLRSLRRFSLRSALTASLATRLAPLLARDSQRLGAAYSLRADAQASHEPRLRKTAVLTRALAAGALERSLDVAAALEVRGYGLAGRPQARRRPWSRHDWAFGLAAIAIVAVTVAARSTGNVGFEAYPLVEFAGAGASAALAIALPALVLTPFAAARLARRRYRRPVASSSQEPARA